MNIENLDIPNWILLILGFIAGVLATIGFGVVMIMPSKKIDNDTPPALHDDDHFGIYSDKENI